jgi:N-acetylneuraminic acid mutarotase
VGSDGKIYLIGGIASNDWPPTAQAFSNMVQCFDPSAGTWGHAAPLPTPRSWAAAASVGNRIYVFGGVDSNWSKLDTVEEFNVTSGQWTTLSGLGSKMPTPRMRLAGVTGSNGRIYAIGGFHMCDPSDNIVEEFNPATQTWRTMTSMTSSRAAAAVVATNDRRIFVLGGFPDGETATAVIEEGTLPTS